MVQLYQYKLLPIAEATSELCGSSWTPAKQNYPEHQCNWGGGGGKEEKRVKHLSGKCFQKERAAVGSCSRGWNVGDGSRGMDQLSEYIGGKHGFLNKMGFIAQWLPPPICSTWDHAKHGTYFLPPGNVKLDEQPCDKLALFMHFCLSKTISKPLSLKGSGKKTARKIFSVLPPLKKGLGLWIPIPRLSHLTSKS